MKDVMTCREQKLWTSQIKELAPRRAMDKHVDELCAWFGPHWARYMRELFTAAHVLGTVDQSLCRRPWKLSGFPTNRVCDPGCSKSLASFAVEVGVMASVAVGCSVPW